MKNDNYPIKIFCVLNTFCLICLFASILFSHGELINCYFWEDTKDTAMDFFHSIEYLNGGAPYETFNTLYPPLANLFFYIIYRCVPCGVSSQWPLDFHKSLEMRTSNLDLRVEQAPLVIYLMFVVMCSLSIVYLIDKYLSKNEQCWHRWVAFSIVFSYGILYAIERGNIVLLSLPFAIYFCFNYKSKNKIVKELALLSLAISAGLKLYPALLGVLLIRDRKWKEAIRAVVYGILSVILPCFAFKEGVLGLKKWIEIVFSFELNSANRIVGNGFSNILYRFQSYLSTFCNINISDHWFRYVSYFIVLILIVMAFFIKKEWECVLLLVLAMCLYQSQADYILSFFAVPLTLFLGAEKRITLGTCIPYFCMLLLVLPLPLFNTNEISYPRTNLDHLVMLVIIAWGVAKMRKLFKEKTEIA